MFFKWDVWFNVTNLLDLASYRNLLGNRDKASNIVVGVDGTHLLGIDMRMATYDLDPDVTRWGLHLIDVCTLTNNGCCNSITRYDQDLSQVEYVSEGYCEKAIVENDEAVARALQEEFTRIDSLEASGLSNVGKENTQASVLAQDWLGPSKRHYSSGNETLAAAIVIIVHFGVISCFSYCDRLPTICRD
jgi:hypothetical protein